MAEIHNQLHAEGLVKEARASLITGGSRRHQLGRLYLTSKRLVFLRWGTGLLASGLIGALISQMLRPKKVEVEIQLPEITGVQRAQYGWNKSVLEVNLRSGFSFRWATGHRYEEWEQAINAVVSPPAR